MVSGTKIFGAPLKYIQGPGTIDDIGAHIALLGASCVFTVGGKTGLLTTGRGREKSFGKAGIRQIEEIFSGETSDQEITRLSGICRQKSCDVLLACGGGKVIDAVKAAAEDLSIPAVIVPTVASNDAPCSALSVIYNEDGSFNRLRPLKKNPDLVLVDTNIIANAPVRTLLAGMGDALATFYEADACSRSNATNNYGGHISQAAVALSKLCRDIILDNGIEARVDCERKHAGQALEKVVEANTLLSGLGFESGGVAVAHALSEGFSIIPETHRCLHGETVAFGLLVHLIVDNQPESELHTIATFCSQVGLPVTLRELGCQNADQALLRKVADAAAEPGKPSGNMPFPVTGSMIYEAIVKADALGQRYKKTT